MCLAIEFPFDVMKVAIVEDQQMFREIVRKVCLKDPENEVVVEAANGLDAVNRIASVKVDVVALDIVLPDIDGIEIISRIRQRGSNPRVLVISSHCSPYLVVRLEQTGVQGFVDKRAEPLDGLRRAFNALKAKHSFFSDSFLKTQSSIRSDSTAFSKLLTKQQMMVLSLVARHMTDAAIGQSICIERRTVEAHRTIIMRKLEVHTRVELMHFAHDQGFNLCPPSESELKLQWDPGVKHGAGNS